jgi:hypothetical protein
MKHGTRKNPHAVALGRLGGLVRSDAKRQANRENGRKGGLVKSRKKAIAARRNARTSAAPCASEELVNRVMMLIRARYGEWAIGRGDRGLRYRAVVQ